MDWMRRLVRFGGRATVTVPDATTGVTLDNEQALAQTIELVGTLTAERPVTFPQEDGAPWVVINSTDGAVTLRAPSGATVTLHAGGMALIVCKPEGIFVVAGGTTLTATALLDFPNITQGTAQVLTVAVPGAVAGDDARATPGVSPELDGEDNPIPMEAGLVWCALADTDVVVIRLHNAKASGAVNPVSRNWRVVVEKF